VTCSLVAAPVAAAPSAGPDYDRDIKPLFDKACVSCHGADKAKGGLRLDRVEDVRKGGLGSNLIVPGAPEHSYLMARVQGQGGEERMPPKGEPLTSAQIEVLRSWIERGAHLPKEAAVPFQPARAGVRRLTSVQYRNIVEDLLGVKATAELEPDEARESFSNITAFAVGTSERGLDLYRDAASEIAAAALRPQLRRAWLRCATLDLAGGGCVEGALGKLVRRLWRRPVAAGELGRYLELARRVAATGGASKGVEAALAALLQSPRFLYVEEETRPLPGSAGAVHTYAPFTMATRLALFLWASGPDDELLDAAQAGRLETAEQVRRQAQRMLEAPRARDGVRRFFDELLGLGELRGLARDRKLYPNDSKVLREAMREEVLRTTEDVVFARDSDALALLDGRETFVNGALAELYGIPGVRGPAFRRVTVPATHPRRGLLGSAAFLATHAIATRPSPTLRGVFIRERILCQEVPPPPDNVSTELPGDKDESLPLTMRQRLVEHSQSPACANCHKFFDPLGLAFESFDAMGAFRATDRGLAIDTSGALDGARYRDAADLAALLRKDPRTRACLVKNAFEFATGHKAEDKQKSVLEQLVRSFAASGQRMKPLLVDIAASDGFRLALPPESPNGKVEPKHIVKGAAERDRLIARIKDPETTGLAKKLKVDEKSAPSASPAGPPGPPPEQSNMKEPRP
jgi:mono/diheme cytochrome c family protein/PAS domain-containing protein